MSAEELVRVLLMAFVLLAPTMMVAVLVSGVTRREATAEAEVAAEVVRVSR